MKINSKTLLLFLFTVFLTVFETTYARPGGGHSYEQKNIGTSHTYSPNNSFKKSSSKNKKSFFDDVELDKNRDVSDVNIPKWIYWVFGIVFGLLALFIIKLNLNDYLKNRKKQ